MRNLDQTWGWLASWTWYMPTYPARGSWKPRQRQILIRDWEPKLPGEVILRGFTESA